MPQHRQLSAILFTDIEGYTSLMQQSEQNAMMMKDRHRQVIQKEHKDFNGRVIQYTGDGTLSTFQSLIEAVRCAFSMQQQFVLQEPHVPVRMGLHFGDIIFNDEEIFGDGVNIASRIESLGIAGSILISDKANEELHNHPSLKTVSVGIYQFKNVKRPVEVFALDHEDLVKPAPDSLSGKTEEKTPVREAQKKGENGQSLKNIPAKSIAVLPFVNIGNDPDQEYFSDGIAEEIINSLTNLKDLKVAGRTSSFKFRDNDLDLNELGRRLLVSTVMAGSVRKQGNRVRITAQLINIEDGYQLWSEKYDREMDDVFAIQDDIAMAITKKLKLTLLKKDQHLRTKKKPTNNTEAYELYLKGRFYVARRDAWMLRGLECFQKAIVLDSQFALAHAAYADALLLIAFYGLMPPRDVFARAKQSAETALQLDPTLCEPYCALGYYYVCFEWNWSEANKNFLKAITLNPQFAEGHIRYAVNYLTSVAGKFEDAESHAKTAIRLEPLSSLFHAMYAMILHCAGRFGEALNACKTGIEVDADSFLCLVLAGSAQMALHRYEEAITYFESARKLTSKQFMPIHGLIWSYCLTGRSDKARTLMNELKERSKSEYVASTFTALSAAYMNENDEAFNHFEKAFIDKDPILLLLKYVPWVPPHLRQDPRFQNLLNRIGFPE